MQESTRADDPKVCALMSHLCFDSSRGDDPLQWAESLSREDYITVLRIGRALWPLIKRPQGPNSYAAGRAGEASAQDALAEFCSEVTRTAHVPHSGDFMVKYRGRRIMVEVKKYSGTVPSAEVEKFESDLQTIGAAAGLFISHGPVARHGAFTVHNQRPPYAVIVGLESIPAALDALHCYLRMEDMVAAASDLTRVERGVEGVVRAREKFQSQMQRITSILTQCNLNMMSAQCELKAALKSEQDVVCHYDPIDDCPKYQKLSPEAKSMIDSILVHRDTWRVCATSCKSDDEVSIHFSPMKVVFPRAMVDRDHALRLVDLGAQLSKDTISVPLDASFMDEIRAIITAKKD